MKKFILFLIIWCIWSILPLYSNIIGRFVVEEIVVSGQMTTSALIRDIVTGEKFSVFAGSFITNYDISILKIGLNGVKVKYLRSGRVFVLPRRPYTKIRKLTLKDSKIEDKIFKDRLKFVEPREKENDYKKKLDLTFPPISGKSVW